MKPYIDEYLTSMAREYWGNANINVRIAWKMLIDKYDENNCEQYLADKHIRIYYNIYLKYKNDFDIEIESKKIYDICNRLREKKINNGITITYLTIDVSDDEVQNEKFWNQCDDQGNIVKVFTNSFIENHPKKDKEVSIEDIKSQLEVNRVEVKNE